MRRAARVDETQPAIVAALLAAGASVDVIGWPVDLLVGFQGKTVPMECKNPKTSYGRKGPNDNQSDFLAKWRGGPVAFVDGPEAALRAIGAVK